MLGQLAKFGLVFACLTGFLAAQSEKYPYWGDYSKTLINEIQPANWLVGDSIRNGWDWSLPESVTPAANAYLCLARNFRLDDLQKIEQLPEVNFPCNPVIAHWVRWSELEPKEGEIDFKPLIQNIRRSADKGYGSIVRIHFSATDYAPEWIRKYGIPIRKEKKENPKSINFEVSHPEFHKRYLNVVKALGESRIPQMEEVKGLFLGYASPSRGDEGIGPHGEKDPAANDREPHVRERIDAWAKACKGVEHKVYMGGLSDYGFSKGFGIRRGFVEMFLYHIPDEHIGQGLDEDGYLIVDETNPVVAKNLFHGEENEEYEEKWATAERDFRFGKNTVSYPYRYFTANLRLLQMRVNYLLNNEFALLPEMLAWVSQGLGRTREDSPDAWCFLRESYIKPGGGRPVKNFERWIHQRDIPGYETEPCVPIEHPIQMWMVQKDKYFDYVARKGSRIGFRVDDKFVGNHKNFAVKITYLDSGTGTWSLAFMENDGIEKRSIMCGDSGVIKTATFFINSSFPDCSPSFDLEILGEDGFQPTVSFIRIIKVL
ncbi:MAG: hypothetical protein AB3N63_19290 [Puniceicoccaceae bacterium]